MTMDKQNIISEQLIYKYINKGTMQFYYSIIKNIIYKILQKNKEPIIIYFTEYHYVTLYKMEVLCREILKKMGTEDVLDVFKCTNNVLTDLSILNNF